MKELPDYTLKIMQEIKMFKAVYENNELWYQCQWYNDVQKQKDQGC